MKNSRQECVHLWIQFRNDEFISHKAGYERMQGVRKLIQNIEIFLMRKSLSPFDIFHQILN
jgi:hypothetical protein